MSEETPAVHDWVAKAEMDYKAALDLASRKKDPLPDKVVYDCAQCVEESLKGFLVLHDKPFRYRLIWNLNSEIRDSHPIPHLSPFRQTAHGFRQGDRESRGTEARLNFKVAQSL